jgi:NTP pyrophosphatase (non-canonical NTP hydrolase)
MTLEEFEAKIVDWGTQRGILPNVDMIAQFNKTMEETQELAQGIISQNKAEVRDAIGDIFVTLVMQTRAWDIDMTECVAQAWNDIKDRKGKMVDGMFVKEAE